MSSDVLQRGARGGSTVIFGQVGRIGIQLVGTVVLARLLNPADFGLVAMATVFTMFGALLRDFGISTAGLQAPTLSHQQASNLFWLSGALSLTVSILLALSSPLQALLYEEPRLTLVAPALAVAILLDGIQSQVQVYLARSMRYLTLTATDLTAQATALLLAVLAAAAGWGPWALVIQVLTASAVLLVTRTATSGWVPTRPRRGHDSKRLMRSGGEFGLAQMLAFAANNADTLVIGTRWNATDLGFYNRAFQIYQLPRTGILDPLTQVAVPTVNSATANGRHRPEDLFLKIQFLLSFTLTWVYLITASTAEWLIPLVLGEQWERSVVLFQILAVGGAFTAFGTVSYWTFIVSQQSRQLLLLHLVTKPLAIVLIAAAAPFGVEAVALAYAAGVSLAWPINLIWLAKTAHQDSWAFFRVGGRVVVAAAISFVLTRVILNHVQAVSEWVNFPLGAVAASLFYVLAIIAVPGGLQHLRGAIRYSRAVIRRSTGE